MAKEVRKPAEVSYADMSAVTAKVDNALAGLDAARQSVQQLKSKELSQLGDQISEIRDQVCAGGGSRGYPRLQYMKRVCARAL